MTAADGRSDAVAVSGGAGPRFAQPAVDGFTSSEAPGPRRGVRPDRSLRGTDRSGQGPTSGRRGAQRPDQRRGIALENTFWTALAMSLAAAAVTALGIGTIRVFRTWGERNVAYFMAFAAGVLVAASFLHSMSSVGSMRAAANASEMTRT